MAIYLLDDELSFPDPVHGNKDGLLAVGGDLSPERLLLAYSQGIFPWFNDDSPIMWWSPDPRMILIPAEFSISKSLSQSMRNKHYEVLFDNDFKAVINSCSTSQRKRETGTWITPEMISAYSNLHDLGYAHSVETYQHGKLVGGLYGISLGKAFFGESMFHTGRDASKVALAHLVNRLIEWDFHFIDAQQQTEHLSSLGARPVRRKQFLKMLGDAINFITVKGKW